MITDLHKKTAKAIVNIFETGKPQGSYGRVTVAVGDKGQLTYGKSQTTLAGGGLYLLIKRYCAAPGAMFSAQLMPFLPALLARDSALNTDFPLHQILKDAGNDAVMKNTQDVFFDQAYWQPSVQRAAGANIATPLGTAVAYDSTVHGNWDKIRTRTNQAAGAIGAAVTESAWVEAYLAQRRAWFLEVGGLLAKCVYRMDSFRQLIDEKKWELQLPMTVRGFVLQTTTIAGPAPVTASAEETERTLHLATPFMEGEDVKALQRALGINDDGVFAAATDKKLREFQTAKGLNPDGIAGPITKSILQL